MDLQQRPVVSGAAPGRTAPRWAMAVAILLAGINLRTAVTSVGPVLDELQDGVGLSSALAGLLTTLPVISFAAVGALTPRLAHRVGEQRLLALALTLMTAGLALRALVGSPWSFLALSVVALMGGATGNVLLPVLVKRHFAHRVGPMTAAYTTALAAGTTLAAAMTVPLATRDGEVDWRVGLGAWAVLAALGALAWLVLPGGSARTGSAGEPRARVAVHRSRSAWALAVFFGAQSMQAYIAFGWFALFFREEAGVSATRAGLLVAVLAAMSVPISMVVPGLAARMPDQRWLIAVLVGCYLVAYTGMLLAPGAGAWLWVVLAGTASGAFPLALTLVGMRTSRPAATAALSAFAQSTGYLIAGTGPVLVGLLHGATRSWSGTFVLLYVAVAVMAVSGWFVGQPTDVEDEIGAVR